MERSQHANNQTFTRRQMNNASTVLHANAKSESVHFVDGKRTILKKQMDASRMQNNGIDSLARMVTQ